MPGPVGRIGGVSGLHGRPGGGLGVVHDASRSTRPVPFRDAVHGERCPTGVPVGEFHLLWVTTGRHPVAWMWCGWASRRRTLISASPPPGVVGARTTAPFGSGSCCRRTDERSSWWRLVLAVGALSATFLAVVPARPATTVQVVAPFSTVTLVANPRPWTISGLGNTINGSTAGGDFARIFSGRTRDRRGDRLRIHHAGVPGHGRAAVQQRRVVLTDRDGIGSASLEVFDPSNRAVQRGLDCGQRSGGYFDHDFPTPSDNVARVRMSNITNLWRVVRRLTSSGGSSGPCRTSRRRGSPPRSSGRLLRRRHDHRHRGLGGHARLDAVRPRARRSSGDLCNGELGRRAGLRQRTVAVTGNAVVPPRQPTPDRERLLLLRRRALRPLLHR